MGGYAASLFFYAAKSTDYYGQSSPGRKKFTEKNPGLFDHAEQQVMTRADDAFSQIAYYLYINGGKQNMPSILKRSIEKKSAVSIGMRQQSIKMPRLDCGTRSVLRTRIRL